MEYTKDIAIKLKLMGFDLCNEYKDDEIHYETWLKGFIDVTVDHTNKEVSTFLEITGSVDIKSLDLLKQLDNLINK